MPRLLDLPLELRDLVIEFTLFSPPAISKDVTRGNICVEAGEYSSSFCYINSDNAYRPNALSLLLVNWQLYHETSSLLARMKPNYSLHVAFVNEVMVWPTWHFIPTKTHRLLERVDLNIVLCSTPGNADEAPEFIRVQPNPELSVICVCTLLQDFFRYGPTRNFTLDNTSSYSEDYRREQTIRTKKLCLNIISSPSPKSQPLSWSEVPVRTIERMEHLDLDLLYPLSQSVAQLFARTLVEELEYALGISFFMDYAIMFTERVGEVVVSIDNIAQTTWDDASRGLRKRPSTPRTRRAIIQRRENGLS